MLSLHKKLSKSKAGKARSNTQKKVFCVKLYSRRHLMQRKKNDKKKGGGTELKFTKKGI
jgi:hypothetical protein